VPSNRQIVVLVSIRRAVNRVRRMRNKRPGRIFRKSEINVRTLFLRVVCTYVYRTGFEQFSEFPRDPQSIVPNLFVAFPYRPDSQFKRNRDGHISRTYGRYGRTYHKINDERQKITRPRLFFFRIIIRTVPAIGLVRPRSCVRRLSSDDRTRAYFLRYYCA